MAENIIFCYSGTGNCLDLARNIAHTLTDTEIILMRKAPVVTDVTEAKRVGFVFPCYGGGAPADVLAVAKTLKLSPDAYTFAVSMSASYAGTGLYELDRIIPLDYWKTVTHHCSCIWLFPHTVMLPMLPLDKAQARSERLAKVIGAEVRGLVKTEKRPPYNPANAAENKAWPMIASRKAAAFKVSDACIGCGQCAKLCPRGNIRMENGRPVIGTNCIQCLGCLQYCPKSAISIGAVTDLREHYHNPNVKATDLMAERIYIK